MRSSRTAIAKPLQRTLARTLKRMLASRGLRLDYLQRDFDRQPIDAYSKSKLFAAMGGSFAQWNARQRVFAGAQDFDATAATAQFYQRWLDTPFGEQQGGSRFNNLLWLFLIAKSYRPSLIVDSGTYQGASAWALWLGQPEAEIVSFDIDLANLKLRCPSIIYVADDWSRTRFERLKDRRVLAYFDDHVDQIKRLLEASDRACQIAIFDDDYPVTSFQAMAPNASALPKIEFALDPELADGLRLEWRSRSGPQSWIVDRGYLDRGLSVIASTERLPNTSLITGIHQTPFRIVSITPRQEH